MYSKALSLAHCYFLFFINDLPQIINHSNLRLYANDTALYCAHENPVIAEHWLQTDLDALVLWCKRNQLTINTTQTKWMTFGTKQMIARSPVLNLTIDDYPIETVSYYKYLGINLDPNHNFARHIAGITSSVSHKIYMLTKVRHMMTRRAASSLSRFWRYYLRRNPSK